MCSTCTSKGNSYHPSLVPNTQSWPVDIFLSCWKRGQPTTLYITVISVVQCTIVNRAASTQDYALLVGEARKLSSYEAACAAAGVTFVPIVMETWMNDCPNSGHSYKPGLPSVDNSIRLCPSSPVPTVTGVNNSTFLVCAIIVQFI